MRFRSTAYAVPLLAAAALAGFEGCVGNIGGGDEGQGPEATTLTCDGSSVSVAPVGLRRLSPEQYVNTMRDLFGDPDFEADLDVGEDVISEREVRQLRDGAELAIARRASWTAPVFPCDTSGPADASCAEAFVDDFGSRAFRRPLSAEERDWLLGVYAAAQTEMSFEEAMETLLQVVIQAPAFVYLFAAGPADASENVRRLTNHELASRLSYFLWGTMPDAKLMEAAASGALSEGEGLRAQAERLLADPRTEETLQRFFSSWLGLDGGRLHHPLEETEKDPELFPEYDAALQAAMRIESEAFLKRVFFEEQGSFDDLFKATYAYVNAPLAELYGVAPPSDGEWGWVDLDEGERGGILTRAAFLTVYAARNVQAPIRRGVWVLEQALCSHLGEPPPNASDVPVEGGEVGGEILTVRQDVIARTSGAECGSCHQRINPIGFTFEHYDAIGRWQTEELVSGLTIDASGDVVGTDFDGEIDGAVALGEALAASETVKSCFAERWYVRALGQAPGELDGCSKDHIIETFVETGSMRELVLAIIESEAFRYVNIEAP